MHFPQLFVLSTIANSIQQISPQKSKIKGKKKKTIGSFDLWQCIIFRDQSYQSNHSEV